MRSGIGDVVSETHESTTSEFMSESESAWYVTVFMKNCDVSSRVVRLAGVSASELRRLFGQDSANPMFDSFPVEPQHQEWLERAMGEVLDLDEFDYYVENNVLPEDY